MPLMSELAIVSIRIRRMMTKKLCYCEFYIFCGASDSDLVSFVVHYLSTS